VQTGGGIVSTRGETSNHLTARAFGLIENATESGEAILSLEGGAVSSTGDIEHVVEKAVWFKGSNATSAAIDMVETGQQAKNSGWLATIMGRRAAGEPLFSGQTSSQLKMGAGIAAFTAGAMMLADPANAGEIGLQSTLQTGLGMIPGVGFIFNEATNPTNLGDGTLTGERKRREAVRNQDQRRRELETTTHRRAILLGGPLNWSQMGSGQ
jgi:hypothetical protein